jgi:hypothetical protein
VTKERQLGNLIHRKGEAVRPAEMPQRGAPAPEAPPTTPVRREGAPADEPRAKSLTLKLSERNYDRLRECGHRNRKTHQALIEEALLRYLDAEGF